MQSRRRSVKIGGVSLPQEDRTGFGTIIGSDRGEFKSAACV